MIRALLVLTLFVVVTVLVLSDIHPTPTKATSASGPDATTTTTTAKSAHPPPTTTTLPPSRVPVVVANASGISGAAAAISAQLQPHGWALLPPTNASSQVTSSHVYYVAGFEAEADTIAAQLGLQAPAVVPYTTAAPISSIGTAEVAVVVGPDLADTISASTTTTS